MNMPREAKHIICANREITVNEPGRSPRSHQSLCPQALCNKRTILTIVRVNHSIWEVLGVVQELHVHAVRGESHRTLAAFQGVDEAETRVNRVDEAESRASYPRSCDAEEHEPSRSP